MALSGAGPAVLIIVGSEGDVELRAKPFESALQGVQEAQLRVSSFESAGAKTSFESLML